MIADEDTPEALLAAALRRDVARHDAGEYALLALELDDTHGADLPFWPADEAACRALETGFRFWDGWCDASQHEWLYYDGIGRDDWPRLARLIADSLERREAITEPVVLGYFEPRPRRSFGEWLREWFSGSA